MNSLTSSSESHPEPSARASSHKPSPNDAGGSIEGAAVVGSQQAVGRLQGRQERDQLILRHAKIEAACLSVSIGLGTCFGRRAAASSDTGAVLGKQRGEPRMWSILWSGIDSMETIQVVLDRKLLQAADRAARRTKQNRSALIRDALREHLRALEIRELEQRDRDGYLKNPQTSESTAWEAEAAWPEE